MATDSTNSSFSPWPLLAGFYFTSLNIFGIWFFVPEPLLVKPNIILSPLFFGLVMLFWWLFIERRGTSTWVRGGFVVLCSSIPYYFIVGMLLGVVSFGAGAVVMWFTAILVVPCLVLAGVLAAVFRKRVGDSTVSE